MVLRKAEPGQVRTAGTVAHRKEKPWPLTPGVGLRKASEIRWNLDPASKNVECFREGEGAMILSEKEQKPVPMLKAHDSF